MYCKVIERWEIVGMKTKLYFSVASTILFAIAVIIFFINGNPQMWFWLCIFCVHYTKHSATKKE